MAKLTARSRRIHGDGTPEAAWQAWPGLAALPEVSAAELVPKGTRAVVVAPHPHDEVLGAGGLMSQLDRLGLPMLLVSVTDGAASLPAATPWPAKPGAAGLTDSQRALAALGLAHVPVSRLGIADGSVSVNALKLIESLCQLLRPQDVVLTTWRFDGHPDHEATGRACAACALNVGARMVEMPIWSWHWAQPGDARLPWPRACRVRLPPDIEQSKRHAVEAFDPSLEADPLNREECVLPSGALARVLRPFEVFFR